MRFITLTIQANGMPLYIQPDAITAICQATLSHIATGVTEVHTPTEIFLVHDSVDEVLEKVKTFDLSKSGML